MIGGGDVDLYLWDTGEDNGVCFEAMLVLLSLQLPNIASGERGGGTSQGLKGRW